MAASSALTVLLFSVVLCIHGAEQRPPRGRHSKRDTTNPLVAFVSEVTQRLTALEARRDNSTEERLARLEAEMKGEVKDKLQTVQEGMQRLESKVSEQLKKLEALNNTIQEVGGPHLHKTCQDYYNDGRRISGVYRLQLDVGWDPITVYCDMSNGTGWVVFQRRKDGSVDFYRDWKSYEDGFGDFLGEFWLGNRKIHRLTSAGLTQLRVNLQAWNDSTAHASYSNFSVGDASSFYTLSASGYSGNAGDSLTYHNGMKFTTHDKDNDFSSGNCAQGYRGAWWYKACYNSNLNGEYGPRGSSDAKYVVWEYWFNNHQSLRRTEMKVK